MANIKNQDDTLQETFDLFFGPTEDTCGTGAVIRVINGELTTVVVDETEHAAFLEKIAEEADAFAAEQQRQIDITYQVNH